MTTIDGTALAPLPVPGSNQVVLALGEGDPPVKLTLANLNIHSPTVNCWAWMYVRRTPRTGQLAQGSGDGPVVVRCNATPKGADGAGNNNAVGCAAPHNTNAYAGNTGDYWNGDGLWVASGCEVVLECHGVPEGTKVDFRLAWV